MTWTKLRTQTLNKDAGRREQKNRSVTRLTVSDARLLQAADIATIREEKNENEKTYHAKFTRPASLVRRFPVLLRFPPTELAPIVWHSVLFSGIRAAVADGNLPAVHQSAPGEFSLRVCAELRRTAHDPAALVDDVDDTAHLILRCAQVESKPASVLT